MLLTRVSDVISMARNSLTIPTQARGNPRLPSLSHDKLPTIVEGLL